MEKESHIVDWEWTDDHSRAFLAMKRAYWWWKQFKDFDPWENTLDFAKRLPYYRTDDCLVYEDCRAAETWFHEMANYHLIELMKVRTYFWT